MSMTKTQIASLVDMVDDNVQAVLNQSVGLQGVEEYGFSTRRVGNVILLSKVTTPRSESVETSDSTNVSTWADHDELVTFAIIPNGSSGFKTVLVGSGDAEGDWTLKALAWTFGYFLTDSDMEDDPGFWNNAKLTIFDGSVGLADKTPNFYLDYESCMKAYDLFATIGSVGDDVTIYYNQDNVELPIAFYDSGLYFTNDSPRIQQMGYKKIVTTYPSTNGIKYGTNVFKISEYSADTYWGLGIFVEQSRWQDTSIVIPVETEYTYLDDTTMSVHSTIVLSPQANYPPHGNNIVTIGASGDVYWMIENFSGIPGGSSTQEAYPTPYYMPPTQIGQHWIGDFIDDIGSTIFNVTTGGGSSITIPEIPGVPHPVLGSDFATTYPSAYANRLDDNVYQYILMDTNDHTAEWWADWYGKVSSLAEEVRDGDNPDNPGGYDEGDGHSPELPDDDGNNTGFTACYHPTKAVVNAFCNWLWDPLSTIADQVLKRFFSNPIEAIISLHKVYITPTNAPGSTTIKLAKVDTGISCLFCDDTHQQLDCGSVTIPEYFQNALDYEQTIIHIFLPFIGFRELSPTDVLGKTLSVKYNVDLLTGACVCDIRVTKGDYSCSIAQYGGNCAVQIPTNANNYMSMVGNITSMANTVIAGITAAATKDPGVIKYANASGAMTMAGVMGSKGAIRLDRGGVVGSSVGELSIKKPFVVVKRPYSSTPYQYFKISGYPASSTVVLRQCQGFTRVKDIHLDSIDATEREKSELMSLLKGGVII